MIRLRQVALVAHDLDKATDEVRRHLAVEVCFRDPGVAEFGLRNALFRIGDQFLEIVSPTREDTTAGRLLHRMGGDCGYMAIFEVDDLDSRMQQFASLGVRTVWQGNFPQIRGRHLHPKDTGGTLVSIDQPTRPGDWHWGGPTWRQRNASMLATAITGITLSSDDPTGLAHRWHELHIDESVAFENRHQRGDCLAAVQLSARQPNSTPRTFRICNVDISIA